MSDISYEERQVRILEFCKEPRSSRDIQDMFGISHQAALGSLRRLRESGHIIKYTDLPKPNGHDLLFKSTGKRLAELKSRKKQKQYNKGFIICGVKF